ncbi:MAG: hypothetical protein AB7U38_10005 [Hyphomicrobiales bacterium]
MKQKSQKPGAIGRLEHVLAVYGANSGRWPDAERASLRELCARDPQAKGLLDEASALDRLLDAAPAGNASAALQARIVAAAAAESGARVVPIDSFRERRAAGGGLSLRRGGFWPAAALAASFAFGIYLGTTSVGTGMLDAAMGGDVAMSDSVDMLAMFGDGSSGDPELPL